MTKQTSSRSSLDSLVLGVGLLLIAAAAVLLGLLFLGDNDQSATSSQSASVLFIGNSYTFGNDLPKMFRQLAKSGGYDVTTDISAVGGWWLKDHLNAPETSDKISERAWDYVVLQEQSVVPSRLDERNSSMYPAARQLVQMIQANNSSPIFFMTWGRRDGFSDVGFDSYKPMQTALTNGYMGIANELDAMVAPVGIAWQQVRQQHPEINLYQEDGSHPSEQGSYLAACVFYATVFQESPEGLRYDAGLSQEETAVLQRIAAETVLSDLDHWHIPTSIDE